MSFFQMRLHNNKLKTIIMVIPEKIMVKLEVYKR